MSNVPDRNKTIDIVRGIGIALVVLGHAEMPHSSIIFRFHMALFFIVSGILFSDKNIQNIKAGGGILSEKSKSIIYTICII